MPKRLRSRLPASSLALTCLLGAVLPMVILGSEPIVPHRNVGKSTSPLPQFPVGDVGGVSYWEVTGFTGWLDTAPVAMKTRVVELLDRARAGDDQDWKYKVLAGWSHEVDLVLELSSDAQIRFVADMRRAKDLFLQIPRVVDRAPLESELSRCMTNVMKVLDHKCPSYFLMLEFRAYVKSCDGGVTKEVQDIFVQIRDERARSFGIDGPMFASDTENIAVCAFELGDLTGAREGLTKCLEIRERTNDMPAAMLQQTRLNLAAVDVKSGRYAEAIPVLTETLAKQTISVTRGNNTAAACYHFLGIAFAGTNQFAEAADSFEKAIKEYHKFLHPAHPSVVKVMEDQAKFLEAAAQPEKAKELRSEIESLKAKWKAVGKQA